MFDICNIKCFSGITPYKLINTGETFLLKGNFILSAALLTSTKIKLITFPDKAFDRVICPW